MLVMHKWSKCIRRALSALRVTVALAALMAHAQQPYSLRPAMLICVAPNLLAGTVVESVIVWLALLRGGVVWLALLWGNYGAAGVLF